jgi:hypothetical protein
MSKTSTENTKPKPRNAKGRPQKIIELAENTALTTYEIGKLTDCDHSNVVRILQRYNIQREVVGAYVSQRASILAGIQEQILQSITRDDIKKAPFGSRILAMCQLYDKERLERNLSTANVATIHDDIARIKAMSNKSE